MCCGDTRCAGCCGWARAGTLYVTTDVPFMTNFTNVCTSVYVLAGTLVYQPGSNGISRRMGPGLVDPRDLGVADG